MRRVLFVALALAVTPFVAGMAQSAQGLNCNNGQAPLYRSDSGTAHAHRGACVAPTPAPPPSCPATAALGQGTAGAYGTVMDGSTYVGLAGWCLTLSGTVSARVMTDASGNYAFTGLPAGSYTICEEIPSGWTETFPGSWGTACPTGYGWSFTLNDGDMGSFLNFLDVAQ